MNVNIKLFNYFIALSSSSVTRICEPILCSANLVHPSLIPRRVRRINLSCQGGMFYPYGLMRKFLYGDQ